ncbi:MAG: transporter substrate-binding domain-containing protein, partial [Eubacteriales bacterium]|nr:transporter substrate-binding domain-containing protein [Eubacteriales bacterium]
MRIKICTVILLLALLLLPFSGVLATQTTLDAMNASGAASARAEAEAAQEQSATDVTSLAGLQAYLSTGKRVGVQVGATHADLVPQFFPQAQCVYANELSDLVVMLETGKIDAYLIDKPGAVAQCSENSGLWMPNVELTQEHYAFAFASGQTALCTAFNAELAKLRADGELEALQAKWFQSEETLKSMEPLPTTGAKGTLILTTDGGIYPFSYFQEGELAGYEVELFGKICTALGYGCEKRISDFSGMIAALGAGKADAALGAIAITAERGEQMLFSDSVYDSGVMVMLPASMKPAANATSATDDLATLAGIQRYFSAGRLLGIQVGTTHDGIAAALLPNAQYAYYNSVSDLLLALESGKIDGYLVERAQGRAQCLTDEQLWMPDVQLESGRCGMALSFGHEALCAQLDELLLRMRSGGTLDQLEEKWFQPDEAQKPLANAGALPKTNGALKLAVTGDDYPFAYIRDGQPVGYSVELAQLLCAELGCGLDVQVMDFAGMIAAVASGKADMATSCIAITEERKEQMLFTEPIYLSGVQIMLPASLRGKQVKTDDLTTVAGLQAYFTADKQLGMQSGTIHDQTAMKYFPDAQRVYTPGSSDLVAALTLGKIDGYLVDQP